MLARGQSARREGAQHGLPSVALASCGARIGQKDAGTYVVMTTTCRNTATHARACEPTSE